MSDTSDEVGGPVVDLLAELTKVADAYRQQPPTSSRTARIVVPEWMLEREDPAEVQRVADEVARAHGFAGAEVVEVGPLVTSRKGQS